MNILAFCAVAFLIILKIKVTLCLESPCPHLLKYDKQTAADRWQAILELRDQKRSEGVQLDVVLDSKADVLINSFGDVTSQNNINFMIKNTNYKLEQGGTLKIKFIVKYGKDKRPPNVISIKLNGVEICANSIPPSSPAVIKETTPSSVTVSSTASNVPVIQHDGVCGIRVQARPLVWNANVSQEHWPWHVAIMIRNADFDYHCGGSLISDRFVLTAAHCVTTFGKNFTIINYNRFLLYLGINHLLELGPFYELRLVADIIVHNEYNGIRYFNDLAVVKMMEPVEFGDYIRPVCLWKEDTDIRDIEGKYATVIGWGVDNTNKTTTELMEAKIPIISLQMCLSYDRTFYSQYLSGKSFCAGGGANGSTVCGGDSGGGLVFPQSDTPGKEIWHIRGIVSVSRRTKGICDTNGYTIFTDTAQYVPWIKKAANLK